MTCKNCATENSNENKFCRECGTKLAEDGPAEEKRQVTVFFADLSGFTAMSERIDAEEVKEIMRGIFGASATIIKKYGGRIDKFIGDCVMAVFGIPRAQEDDALRAINAAIEIREAVDAFNTSELEARIGTRLSMHTGINTGIVVSGDLDLERGSEKILGDTVNVAARLSGVAAHGEIVVGRDTFGLADWRFEFAEMPPVSVKGKVEPLLAYKVLGHKKAVDAFRRSRGTKADFVGRDGEIAEIVAAAEALESGECAVVSVSGEAGAGKSRLVSEFKARMAPRRDYSWHEAFANSQSENVAYSVWIDFMSRVLSIEESDSKETVGDKLKKLGSYAGGEESLPYLAALYAVPYPETRSIDPGYLKTKIAESVVSLVRAIAERGKTIFYFEDLHWADPSSVEILRRLLEEPGAPALYLCVHRPGVALFQRSSSSIGDYRFREISLSPLGSGDEEKMIASLLDSQAVPEALLKYIAGNISGNPFYIEEIVNNLIETGALSFDAGRWTLTRDLTETEIPLTVQGVITSRIDRIDPKAKRILQTASVIGRLFYHSLLGRLTEPGHDLDGCIEHLESMDLIREFSREPDVAYLFKHALMHDVVYDSLLKKERGAIHQRVAELMESLFGQRIEEFYETIAYHYQKSGAADKAVEYLIKAGRKSMASYAAEEANAYFRQAYDIVTANADRSVQENDRLVGLLNDWGFAHYTLGTFPDWAEIFRRHVQEAESIPDKGACALFYAEYAYALDQCLEDGIAFEYSHKALRLAEEAGDKRALAYSHCWIAHGETGMRLARELGNEPYLFAKSGYGKAYCLALRGNASEAEKTAREILKFGEERKNPRCLALAHLMLGDKEFNSGDFDKALEYYRAGFHVTMEPFYVNFLRANIGYAQVMAGELDEAQETLEGCERFFETVRSPGVIMLAIRSYKDLILSKRFQYAKAFAGFKEIYSVWRRTSQSYTIALVEYSLGEVYLGMVLGAAKVPSGALLRNLPFILGSLPFAHGRAVGYFQRALEIAKAHGIYGMHGRSALNLGLLNKKRRRYATAKEYLAEAIAELEKTDLADDLERARMELGKVAEVA